MLRHILKRQYDPVNNSVCYPLAKGSEELLQRMSRLQAMVLHQGCVNTVVWDAPGNLLLSGSDDQHLVICDPWARITRTRIHTAHRANIFSAKFLPHSANRKIISCSGDGIVIYTDVERQEETHDCKFNCHASTCYDVITLPDDPHTFLTCGEDDTVRWFDLRVKEKCSIRECQEDILLNMGRAVTAVAINPITPFHLAVATQDSTIRIYDRRVLGTRAMDSYLEQADRALLMRLKPDNMENKNHRVTSLRYSADGKEILASYSSDFLYLFDTQNYKEVALKTARDTDSEANTGPTLKRLRLRGDWSDTGPQALPESEMRNQAGDVGQARPTLHATLMQRMTDVLSRMLNDPGTRASVQRTTSESESSQNQPSADATGEREAGGEDGTSQQQDVNPEPPPSVAEGNDTATEIADAVANNSIDLEPVPSCSYSQRPTETEAILVQEEELGTSSELTTKQEGAENSATQVLGSVSKEPLGNSEEQRGATPTSQAQEASGGGAERMSTPGQSHVQSQSESQDNIALPGQNLEEESSFEGLQTRISSLRQGFVNKHQVEPSVNLSYSSQGAATGRISLGVGDEISRDCAPQPSNATPIEPPSATQDPSATPLQVPQPQATPDLPLCSSSSSSSLSSSPTASCQPPTAKTHRITTSNSSPAICDMEVDPTAATTSHGGRAGEAGVAGPCAGSRASEMNVGPTLDFGDDDSDDESTNTSRSASARMASAIERAVQRVRGERAPGVGGEAEATVPQAAVKQCYKGHRNTRTMIKEACFWGDSHVMSGSDCGRVFVWERKTSRLVMLWEADRHVVNCLQPHPTLPVLATSGIDYDVKLWAPLCEESLFDEAKALEITQRNEALLEETRDTITVPATFMIRMLASLNQIRRGTSFAERWRNRRQARRQGEDDDLGNAE